MELGELRPDEVVFEVVVGNLGIADEAAPMTQTTATRLAHDAGRDVADGAFFEGAFTAPSAGHLGVTARVMSLHKDLVTPVEMGLVRWA